MNHPTDRPGTPSDVRGALLDDHPTVLFVGSGCHYYLKGRGVQYPKSDEGAALFNWTDLLRRADANGAPPRHTDNTAVWESIVARRCARDPGTSPREEERVLLKGVRSTLLQTIPDATDRELVRFGSEIVSTGATALVTLNFDRTLDRALAQGGPGARVVRPSAKDDGDYRTQLFVDTRGIRTWYAHGMADESVRFESIQLGLVGYAESVAALRQRYADYRRRRTNWLNHAVVRRPGGGYWPPGVFREWARRMATEATSWLDLVLTAHVIFLGCGLSQAETDVWYALHARQRELAGVGSSDRPQTFYLHPLELFPAHLTTRPAGIRPVITESFDDAWSIVLGVHP